MGRYDRHHILEQIGIEGQQRLADSSVLIVGVGGLGSPIALYLAAAGVGRLGLIDGDRVSLSNLQRQVLYVESELGESKVECARRRLLAHNSGCVVEGYDFRLTQENAEEIISKYDIVVDGCDNYATRYLIDDVCNKLGVPYVYGAIGEFSGQVSIFNHEGGVRYRDLFPDQEELCARPKSTLGVIGSVPGVVGTIQATETIKLIVGCGELLAGRLFTINLLTMETQTINL